MPLQADILLGGTVELEACHAGHRNGDQKHEHGGRDAFRAHVANDTSEFDHLAFAI